jgi:U3 small nucleolar RNA-associated protein 10
LTFLPYHTSSIFLTLLSLLPKTLPPILRFLHPYIEALALPPRHAIIYTASHNPNFFTTFNNHVLDLCRSGYHFPAICSFWATLTAESIAGIFEQSHSALHKVQKESQEDLMLRIMPILNEGLVMEDVPDLQIGCYMILIILTTKVALSDTVLNAAMGAVISNWSQTTSAGLICLAALAQQRELVALPKKVLAALLALEKLVDDLNLLKTQYRVDNIALGVLLGVLERLERRVDEQHVDLVRSLLESELMEMSYITVAITTIISKLQKHGIPHDAKISLTNLLYSLAEDENLEAIIRNATKDNGSILPQPKGDVQGLLTAGINGDEPENEGATIETRRVLDAKAFQKAVGQIPEESSDETSFLAYSSSNTLFDYLSRLFILASSTTDQMEAFSHVPVLRKPLSRTHPVFLSFFIRFWCSGAPAIARAAAIHSVSDHLIQETPGQDMQILFPYVLYGLADPSVDVRRAATKLVLALGSVYRDRSKDANGSITKIFGQENIYGRAETPISTAWLSPEDAANFVELALLRDLEEALLDPTHISRHICDLLRGRRSSRTGQKELKSSARQAFFAFLCSHTVNTSFYRVRYRLLQILCQMERVGALSRTKALLPLLLEYRDQAQEELNGRCIREHIEPESLLEQVVEIVLPTDREGVQVLQAMVETEKEHPSRSLCYAANLRIRKMWPSMKQELQQSISISLFEYAVGERAFEGPESLMDEALETLRTAPLSTSILQALLDICLDLFKKLENDTYTPKRRRTNVGFTDSSSATLQNAKIILKRLTTTLELVEISKPEKHLGLMKGLFQILAELQNSRSHFGTEMGYLQTLVLESIYAMVKEFEVSSRTRVSVESILMMTLQTQRSTVSKIDKSAIRPDVIVESIRTAASAQVQHVALLLISGLATISPESVLHSVMPVFTFMGAGILRQNDDYSVYVVDRVGSNLGVVGVGLMRSPFYRQWSQSSLALRFLYRRKSKTP